MKLTPVKSNSYSSTYDFSQEFNNFKSLDDYKNAFNKFKNENGHFPNSHEIDETPYLPSSRTIQRKFSGGLREIRSLIGLDEIDHRVGEQRSSCLRVFLNNSINIENEIYIKFLEYYSPEKVHRQEPYSKIIKNMARSDWGIYNHDRHFYIDIFTPKDIHSLQGCVLAKLRKFKKFNITSEVYLVIGNPEMNEEWVIKNKKVQNLISRLPSHVKIIPLNKCLSLIENKFVV